MSVSWQAGTHSPPRTSPSAPKLRGLVQEEEEVHGSHER